jgi:hypothetical protein
MRKIVLCLLLSTSLHVAYGLDGSGRPQDYRVVAAAPATATWPMDYPDSWNSLSFQDMFRLMRDEVQDSNLKCNSVE